MNKKDTKEHMTQINLPVPKSWKEQLEAKARKIAVERDMKFSHLDLMRETLRSSLDLQD